jgi:hypothetical protein
VHNLPEVSNKKEEILSREEDISSRIAGTREETKGELVQMCEEPGAFSKPGATALLEVLGHPVQTSIFLKRGKINY